MLKIMTEIALKKTVLFTTRPKNLDALSFLVTLIEIKKWYIYKK